MYKKALNSFFLKVHPDFFQHNRYQQTINENAVAQLNELLSWAREFKGGALRPPPATSISFTFYRRLDDGDNAADGSAAGRMSETASPTSSSLASRLPSRSLRSPTESLHPTETMHGSAAGADASVSPSTSSSSHPSLVPEDGAVAVHSTFELPEHFSASEANRGVAERAVNKFLRDLLRRAECIDAVSEAVSAAEDVTAARMEAKPLRSRPGVLRKKRSTKPKSLLDEATEAIAVQWTLTPTPTVEELMDADQVLFSKTLSPLQCSAALHTLRGYLGEMHYSVWESMPLLVSDHFAIGELTGCITVPWDFTPAQFVSFLRHNEEGIARCRRAALDFATDVEQLIADLTRALDWDDVLISCSHKDALPVLRLLHRNKELLHGYGVTHLTVEIGGRYATRANGVLILSSEMRTLEALREWLAAVQPKLALQKKLYTVSKHLLETTMWHLKEFRDMAEPGGVDAFQQNDCTYAQRLEWARELFRIGPSLAQWDWSEFTFLLSPELDLDWAHRQLFLPYNFDGDAFIRYVEEIQQEAKQRAHDALLQASAHQRTAEEASRARAHAAALQLDSSDLLRASDFGDQGPNNESTSSSSASAFPSAAAASSSAPTPQDRLRTLYRQTSPYTEEYLTSSEDRLDTLSVEQPLSHAVTFNADEDAEDQLKWEGFYQEPLVDQVPTGDLDDLTHTYYATNRWYRQEAAKKLLSELQTTYQKNARRFDYQKMGDVLEINNAKVQPKGFPTVTRGVKPGGM